MNLSQLLTGGVLAMLIAACASNTTQTGQAETTSDSTAIATFESTRWQVVSLPGAPVPDSTQENVLFVQFETGTGRVSGFAGCNNFSGTYTLQSQELSIRKLISTKKACPGLAAEQALLNALESANRYQILVEALELYRTDSLVATFTASGR